MSIQARLDLATAHIHNAGARYYPIYDYEEIYYLLTELKEAQDYKDKFEAELGGMASVEGRNIYARLRQELFYSKKESWTLKAELNEARDMMSKVFNEAIEMDRENRKVCFEISTHNTKLEAELKEADKRIREIWKACILEIITLTDEVNEARDYARKLGGKLDRIKKTKP